MASSAKDEAESLINTWGESPLFLNAAARRRLNTGRDLGHSTNVASLIADYLERQGADKGIVASLKREIAQAQLQGNPAITR